MQSAIVGLLLSGLGREAIKAAATLGVAVLIAMAFTVSSLGVLLGLAMPGDADASGLAVGPGNPWAIPSTAALPGGLAYGPATDQVTTLARSQIGRPYVWGGASPATSFDCSGLVQWIYGQIGVRLPRTAQQQYDATVRLSPAELRPGDLVFFQNTYPSSDRITHIGIYVGDGRMINAPTEGDVIREMSVFTGFWGAHFAGAGRVRGDAM